jgi:hypothetical protein
MHLPETGRDAASPPTITLLIPGLFDNPARPSGDDSGLATLRDVPALCRLLTRADRTPLAAHGYEARLFAQFGVTAPAGQDLPVAAVSRVTDMGVIDHEWWVRADPVHLAPRRDGLVLFAGLDLSRAEADRLVTELSEALAADGLLLKAPCPERWYLKPAAAAAITTTPLAEAVGHDIHPLLPRGADAKAWHTRLNEIQILLHTSPVNVAREARGSLAANSVWFWGGGRLPQLGRLDWTRVWSIEPLSLGLARLAGISVQPPPAGAAELTAPSASGAQLLVLAGPGALLQSDPAAWRRALRALNDHWLAPLLTAVHRGALASLSLIADTGPVFHYRRAHRWRLWRRTRPLSAWCEAA